MNMRILLTGKNGQVGFELQRSLALLGDVLAFDRTALDLAEPAAVRQVLRDVRPDVIVNAAAYTAVDRAESDDEKAHAVNVLGPAVIGEEAARIGALVVHYSTDYVFDGRFSGFQRENTPADPQNVYGRTKLAGEMALRESGARHLIFRTSWVFGVHGANFLKTMLRLAGERNELAVVADQFGAPTSAALIADVTAHAVWQVQRNATPVGDGLYHLAAAGETSWHGYACHVIEQARARGRAILVAPEAIRPIATADYPTPAKRPANSRLDTGKLQKTFDLVLPHWREGVDHVLEQILRAS